MPTPEQKARKEIDQQLARAGWLVQDYAQMHLSAGPSVAVREFPLQTGFADYLLYLDGRAAGVIEAKPEGHSLIGVELQSLKYMNGLPENVPAHGRPLPFGYESTGTETRFSNSREPDYRSREVFTFHRPEELRRQLALEGQLRALGRASSLRQSVLKQAFQGRLVPQDPSNEPASVLLERIKEEREQVAPDRKVRRRSAAVSPGYE